MKELDMFNLDNFREREMELAADLLRSYVRAGLHRDGKQYNALPESWCDDGVKLAFNPNSGFVFLSNEESQALVDTEDGIAMWYFTPYYGVEGILEDVAEAFIDDVTDADGKLLPPDEWGNWATDDYCDARYLLDVIRNDADALVNPDPVIEQAREYLAHLPADEE